MRSSHQHTTNFVQDYAAKRQAQMERAKALREMREAKQRVMTEQPPPSSSPPPPHQQTVSPSQSNDFGMGGLGGGNQRMGGQAPPMSRGTPTASSATSAQRLGMNNVEYPPPLPQHQLNNGYSNSSTPNPGNYQQPPPRSAPTNGSASTERITVVEDDFYRAVSAGIITQDQARQLWAVISDNPEPVHQYRKQPPAKAPVQAMQPKRTPPALDEQPIRGGGSGSGFDADGSYNPRDYAPPSSQTFEEEWNSQQQQQPAAVGQRPSNTKAKAKPSKPQWNDNWAEETPEPVEEKPVQPAPSITQQYGAKQAAAKKQAPPKPDWNSDFASPESNQYDALDNQPVGGGGGGGGGNPFARAAKAKKAQTASPAHDAGAWNSDTTGIPDEPPPVPGRRSGAPPQKKPTRQAQQLQPQEEDRYGGGDDSWGAPPAQEEQPVRRQPAAKAAPKRSSGTVGTRGRAQQQQQEEYVAPVQQDSDEVAEFERMKAQQQAEFEQALEEANTQERMVPCALCGRTFREGIIDRHMKACQKANKKRKEFNMKDQRADGVEGLKDAQRNAASETRAAARAGARGGRGGGGGGGDMPANKIPKWKLQHQQFQAAMAANKPMSDNGTSGGPPPPMPAQIDDRVPCPHCGRKFANDVAERHIPKCKNIIAKPKQLRR